MGLEFGEKVVFMRKKIGGKLEKIKPRWEKGVFVGVKRKSNEVMVVNEHGVAFVRSVRRLAFEDRWGPECKDWVVWAPWNKYEGDTEADGDLPEGVEPETKEEGDGSKGPRDGKVYVDVREKVPREFYISEQNIRDYKPTKGCAGCRATLRGLSRQPDEPECRERFRELLKDMLKYKIGT